MLPFFKKNIFFCFPGAQQNSGRTACNATVTMLHNRCLSVASRSSNMLESQAAFIEGACANTDCVLREVFFLALNEYGRKDSAGVFAYFYEEPCTSSSPNLSHKSPHSARQLPRRRGRQRP